MKPHIVVIGSTNTDMIIKVPHLPSPGETVLGGEFSVVQGGKGANQAVAAARAGGRVTFISCVGNDLFGKRSLEELKKDNIDIHAIKIVEGVSSGVALINVSGAGENSISVAPGANSKLLAVDIDKSADIIKTADIILLQLEIPLDTVRRAVELAAESNIPVILNPAPACRLDEQLLEKVSILTPNENEAALLTDLIGYEDDFQTLTNNILKKGVKNVVLTLGKKGAYFSGYGNEGHIPGCSVTAVDSTAAGDTFNGYLAVSMARGQEINCAIKTANTAAAISVTRMGAQPSIPFYDEVIDFDKIHV